MSITSVKDIDTKALEREIRRRHRLLQSAVRRLTIKRKRLFACLAAVERDLKRLRARPENETDLVGALTQLLNGTTMSVTEAALAVQKAGYRTSSRNFRVIVNQTLINPDRFTRVSRGRYTSAIPGK